MQLSALLFASTVQMFLIFQITSAPNRSFDYDFDLNNTTEMLPLNAYKGALTEMESQTNLPKKWIMGRAGRINNAVPYMLFKKKYIFRNEAPAHEFFSSFDSGFAFNLLFTKVLPNNVPKIPMTTESNIEFYYLNENQSDLKQKTKITDIPKHTDCLCKLTSKNLTVIDSATHRPLQTNKPVHLETNSYTANDGGKPREKARRNYVGKPVHLETNSYTANDGGKPREKARRNYVGKPSHLETNSYTANDGGKAREKARRNYVGDVTPLNTSSQSTVFLILQRVERDDHSGIKKSTSLSTLNDRIKFFEQYDSLTEVVNNSTEEYTNHNNKYLAKKDKLLIEYNVNDDYGFILDGLTTPYVKKHSIVERDITVNVPINDDINKEATSSTSKDNINYMEMKSYRKEKNAANTLRDDIENEAYQNSMVWSKYPFTAVYVYEQYRVHCDAAAINPYWLLASATCLSRHREDSLGEDRSAFITYCGDNWWYPERINYVKSTHIHPNFHPGDTVRRHVFNVGVIQVVTSMATSCQNWAPISIMSHQYVAESDNSIGLAVGWGLDRYDTSYSSTDLPKRSLAVYKGLIYSNKCPGNAGYSLSKLLGDEATRNIYCLALPVYEGEVNDPIHGGLLLVGGKLVALYLQEERHRFGKQSAQYTGIWKLLPWVLQVAKEPEEFDLFLD